MTQLSGGDGHPIPVCVWGTSHIRDWLILLLHSGPKPLSSWAPSLPVRWSRVAVAPLVQAAWRGCSEVTSLAYVQLGRQGSAAVRLATDLAMHLGILCKVGHAVPVIPDHWAVCQGLCRAPCLSRSFRKVQKRKVQPTGHRSASAQSTQCGGPAWPEEFAR